MTRPSRPFEPRVSRAQVTTEALLLIVGVMLLVTITIGLVRSVVFAPTQAQINATQSGQSGFQGIVPSGQMNCQVSASPSQFASPGGSAMLTVRYSNLQPAGGQVSIACPGGAVTAAGCADARQNQSSCQTPCTLTPNAGSTPATHVLNATVNGTACTSATVVVAPPAVCAGTVSSCGPTGSCVACTSNLTCVNSTHLYTGIACAAAACQFTGPSPCPYTCASGVCTGGPYPNVTLMGPASGSTGSGGTYQDFVLRPVDDTGFSSLSVWSNVSGAWAVSGVNASTVVNNTNNTLSLLMPMLRNAYLWTAHVCDREPTPQCTFNNTNYTLTLDAGGPAFALSSAAGMQIAPHAAYNNNSNEFYVVYASNQSHATSNVLDTGPFELYGVRVNASSGALLGTPQALTSGGTRRIYWYMGFGIAPIQAAYAPGSDVYGVLFRANNSNGFEDLKLLSAKGSDGSLNTGDVTLAGGNGVDIAYGLSTGMTEGYYALAANPFDDEFGVLWKDNSTGGWTYKVYFQRRRASDLALLGSTVTVYAQNLSSPSDAGYTAGPIALTYNNDTKEYLATLHYTEQHVIGSDYFLQFARITAANGTVQPVVNTNSSGTGYHTRTMTYNPNRHEYLYDFLNATAGTQILFNRLGGVNASIMAPTIYTQDNAFGWGETGLGYLHWVTFNPSVGEYVYGKPTASSFDGETARRMTDTGTLYPTNITVASTPSLSVGFPQAVFALNAPNVYSRNHLVVWSATGAGDSQDAYARLILG